MRIVIIGGGVSTAYLANTLLHKSPASEVLIVSDESHAPYDRIHLCALAESLEDAFILQDITGSNHCPVGIRLKI